MMNRSKVRIENIKKQIFPEIRTHIQAFAKTLSIDTWIKEKLSNLIKSKKLPFFLQSYLVTFYQKHYFNMIEILIAISIIVTFSTLTGAVFAKKWEESKENYAKL